MYTILHFLKTSVNFQLVPLEVTRANAFSWIDEYLWTACSVWGYRKNGLFSFLMFEEGESVQFFLVSDNMFVWQR